MITPCFLGYSHIRTHTLTNDDSPLSTLLNKVDSRTVVSNMTQGKKGFDCPLCNKKAFASAEVSCISNDHVKKMEKKAMRILVYLPTAFTCCNFGLNLMSSYLSLNHLYTLKTTLLVGANLISHHPEDGFVYDLRKSGYLGKIK